MERIHTSHGSEALFRDLELLLADAAAERPATAPPAQAGAPAVAPESFDAQILAGLVSP